jgi:ribosomal protein S18 acetylase RimI-like enzyme
MTIRRITDKKRLAEFCRREAELHLYEIGDLDDFFWKDTRFFAFENARGDIEALVLLYEATSLPVLLAIAGAPTPALEEVVRALLPDLPPKVYAHLSPGLLAILAPRFHAESHGVYAKMALVDRARIEEPEPRGVTIERLAPADQPDVLTLYAASYPGNWFDPRMLETGQYFGARDQGALVAVAGVHVFSAEYRVAAIGNVATLPERRGHGLGKVVTARLCRSLLEHVDRVGLNVKADNAPAIACYRALGFVEVTRYEEIMLEAR